MAELKSPSTPPKNDDVILTPAPRPTKTPKSSESIIDEIDQVTNINYQSFIYHIYR